MADRIPPGYKKTEIGIIPEDWKIGELEEIAEVIDPHPSHRAPPEVSRGIPFVGIGDLDENGNIINDNVRIVHPKILEEHKKRYNLYDNLIGLGRVASIGKVVKLKEGKYAVSPTMGIIKSNYIEWRYLYYILQSKYVIEQFNKIMTGSTRSSVGMIVLRKSKIPYPPTIEEQRAIARVLSDVDKLIESLDKLIEKKKLIKKGAMQELLTGKKRLPGFKGEWVRKKLGEVAEIYQPETISQSQLSNVGYNVYGANGIIGKYHKYNHEFWQNIITCRGSTCGMVNRTTDKCWITGNAMVINVDKNKSIDKLFMFYLLKFQDFTKLITGSGQPQIIRKPLVEFIIHYPSDIEEQRAIAQILSDMDAEIEALEKKKAKYEMIKKGMMQLLLTGKVRLKDRIKEVLK
ncbi:restriction endonuclease subunit S [Thermosipho melanesiensis]|uniref:Restriction modification system DNA specificity domain n=2 Tax=Thermosipho melanesiensis TaxID=46541 RepID=A6LK21_THEM4|nr:restriction endonuclease subunit S [Thermosipho melanesiensis]ABR30272.1 restriction modification system DNA specificity domain [Thermosipho melanesiensis BI429]APT73453.1 type I restriction endonuclease S subunit [Thermosipho melanesiensis]